MPWELREQREEAAAQEIRGLGARCRRGGWVTARSLGQRPECRRPNRRSAASGVKFFRRKTRPCSWDRAPRNCSGHLAAVAVGARSQGFMCPPSLPSLSPHCPQGVDVAPV